jgi:hypothetical protein
MYERFANVKPRTTRTANTLQYQRNEHQTIAIERVQLVEYITQASKTKWNQKSHLTEAGSNRIQALSAELQK